MNKKTIRKIRKANRNRAKIHGTALVPRIAVMRSNRYLHVQLIDDNAGKTVVSGSTLKMAKTKDAKDVKEKKTTKTKQAETLGTNVAKLAKDAGIKQAVLDRRSYRYHGRVKAFTEGARAAGLKI